MGKKLVDDELKMLSDWCIYENKDKIREYLSKKSDDELLKLFEKLNANRPDNYKPVVCHIINKLYSSSGGFIKLLCELIEGTSCYFYLDELREVASVHEEKTLSIVKKILDMRTGSGRCSGILASPLLGQNLIDEDILLFLKTDDLFLQRHALFAIYNYIDLKPDMARFFIEELAKTVEKIDKENIDLLFQVMIGAFSIDNELSIQTIEKEIERFGHLAALEYVRNARFRKDLPISLLKKSVQLIEVETAEDNLIDDALSTIYEKDPDFVVKRLRERLQHYKVLANEHLKRSIRNTGNSPVIQMFEEEIDKGNLNVGESIIGEFFPSANEWLKWCETWKSDTQKRPIVIRSLSKILTDMLNGKSTSILDGAIILTKYFAEEEGLNYEEETKKINFGKKQETDEKYREYIVKALYVLKIIRSYYRSVGIDAGVLRKNLANYPNISKALDTEWLIKTAKSSHPHPLAIIYSSPDITTEQQYWESVFKRLNDANLKMPRRKLKDMENTNSFLTEAEVIAKLVSDPDFKVSIEPDVTELEPKKIDLKLDFKEEEALIEIAYVQNEIEPEVGFGAFVLISGKKVKNVLLSKLEKQLKGGKVDPRIPIVLVLHTDISSYYMGGLENAIYGERKNQIHIRTDTHKIISDGMIREKNSFYEKEGSDIVTAIAAYINDSTKEGRFSGKLYHPPINPRNPMSREFRLRLRNALFGESETSCWQSLMKIEGVDEKTAKKLHSEGVEDLGTLTILSDKELEIDGFTMEQLKEFQEEAKRILYIISTEKIDALKKMNKEIYDILTRNNIYLVSDLLELDNPPESINLSLWESLLEDARRIMDHNCGD